MQAEFDNTALAERLEAFAALLDLAGASYYTARAYRRAAELDPVDAGARGSARSCRAGCASYAGSGLGIERRLVELVETGRIAELDELERRCSREIVGLGRFLGLVREARGRDRRGVGRGHGGGVPRGDRDGRLARCRVSGRRRRRSSQRGARARGAAAAARAYAQPRAGLSCEPIAEAAERCGGGRSAPLAGRCPSDSLLSVSDNNALERFHELPQIVGRRGRRPVGVTVEGVPVELVVAPADRFGTELLRATAPRTTSPRSSRSPRGRPRRRSTPRSACRGARRSCARSRTRASRRARSS